MFDPGLGPVVALDNDILPTGHNGECKQSEPQHRREPSRSRRASRGPTLGPGAAVRRRRLCARVRAGFGSGHVGQLLPQQHPRLDDLGDLDIHSRRPASGQPGDNLDDVLLNALGDVNCRHRPAHRDLHGDRRMARIGISKGAREIATCERPQRHRVRHHAVDL